MLNTQEFRDERASGDALVARIEPGEGGRMRVAIQWVRGNGQGWHHPLWLSLEEAPEVLAELARFARRSRGREIGRPVRCDA